jgi:NAD(P)-dependent dehydrogenase (short-subunit alcohol dehydrogenase family)
MNKMFDMSDKVVIVTGGNRGNGYEISKGLSDAGAKVIRIDKSFTSSIDSDDYEINLSNEDHIINFFNLFIKKYKKLDGLINNAGISIATDRPYENLEVFDETLSINLRSAWILSSKSCELMAKNKKGSIVNITSLGAELGFPNNPSYQISKAGLKQMTKAMAVDWGGLGIRINNICPGYIRTAMTEESFNNEILHDERKNKTILKRWGMPSDLIGASIFLLSDASSYITGTDLRVDGGWTAKGL